MRCKYPNRDLQQRLDNTICRYKNIPYKIRTDGGVIRLYSLLNDKQIQVIEPHDPDLDISTVPLGYVQVNPDYVSYLIRRPVRMYKQGVSNECVTFNYIRYDKTSEFRNGLVRHNGIFSPFMHNSIMNEFPSEEQALQEFEKEIDKYREIAISRDIALAYNPNLQIITVYFKQKEIGFIVRGTKTVITPSNEFGWIITQNLSNFNWDVQ